VFGSSKAHEMYKGCAGRTSATYNNLYIAQLFTRKLEGICKSSQKYNGRTMLVVVHHWDVELSLKPPLNLKASWCREVLKIDAPKRWGNGFDGRHNLVYILGGKHYGHCINICKLFKE
jgi:hypothetical protein